MSSICGANQKEYELDVISYHLNIEPEIHESYIKGTVTINFQISPNANSIVLNSGSLQIDSVAGKNVVGFRKNDDLLIIELSKREKRENEITIKYHGSPTKGLLFNSKLDQAYTVYFTSQWMICNDKPSDKATLNLNLLIPNGLKCIANGELIGVEKRKEKHFLNGLRNMKRHHTLMALLSVILKKKVKNTRIFNSTIFLTQTAMTH